MYLIFIAETFRPTFVGPDSLFPSLHRLGISAGSNLHMVNHSCPSLRRWRFANAREAPRLKVGSPKHANTVTSALSTFCMAFGSVALRVALQAAPRFLVTSKPHFPQIVSPPFPSLVLVRAFTLRGQLSPPIAMPERLKRKRPSAVWVEVSDEEHAPRLRGALRGLDARVVLADPNRSTELPSSGTVRTTRTTRATIHGPSGADYDMKYHPSKWP